MSSCLVWHFQTKIQHIELVVSVTAFIRSMEFEVNGYEWEAPKFSIGSLEKRGMDTLHDHDPRKINMWLNLQQMYTSSGVTANKILTPEKQLYLRFLL